MYVYAWSVHMNEEGIIYPRAGVMSGVGFLTWELRNKLRSSSRAEYTHNC